jgi:hypothetical protein
MNEYSEKRVVGKKMGEDTTGFKRPPFSICN